MTEKSPNSRSVTKFSRRQFLTFSGLAVGASLVMAGGYLYANNEANDPVIDYIKLPITDLDPALEGFTIAALADFHLYPFTQIDLIKIKNSENYVQTGSNYWKCF